MTLAVNTGTAIYYDKKALARWQARHRRSSGQQSASEFRSTVSRLAGLFPGKVH